MKICKGWLQALLSSAPRGFAARSRVLARLVSLAQIGELARRLTQHARIDFALFIAFSILRRYLAFGEKAAKKKKKRKACVRFRHRNRERKGNRRASLTKNGQQNWQRATKAHFISKRSGSRSWIFRKAKTLQLLRVQAAPKSSLKSQMKKAN